MEALTALLKEKEREKEREKEKERDREKEKEKEKEKEGEMEAALYANCLLLGLDASVLGPGAGTRAGLFRHSNPRVGEALLHFLLCALRGPYLSAKDFAGVWPIFDAAQSRDFRKIVQGLINDLEAQGALPRSNSRVSSLATCCGQRFVELLWQLSAHALREVHRRTFPTDVATNPLPASLTEVVSQNSHAAALLGVTKARIALERRRFLEGAATAVRRQSIWSSLAHDMTAEYRSLCAEEAYLHQELEKLQDPQDGKAISEESPAGDLRALATDPRVIPVARATQLWESLLAHAERNAKLASGPIEDLIAHREHRYRIDGAVLRAAMDRGSSGIQGDLTPASLPDDANQRLRFDEEGMQMVHSNRPPTEGLLNDDMHNRVDDRSVKGTPALDVAEVLRRWTHALQRIHKQTVRLARSNDGAGPEFMKDALDSGEDGHAHALHATLAEHQQHLANVKVLMKQLKDSMPGMELAIASLRQQVDDPDVVSASNAAQSALIDFSPTHHTAVSLREPNTEQGVEEASNSGALHLELVPPSPHLKLPHVSISSSTVSMERVSRLQPQNNSFSSFQSMEGLHEVESLTGSSASGNAAIEEPLDMGDEGLASLKQAVREAALSKPNCTPHTIPERLRYSGSEHYFTPISPRGNSSESSRVAVFMATGNTQPLECQTGGRKLLVSKSSGYGAEFVASTQRVGGAVAASKSSAQQSSGADKWTMPEERFRSRKPEPELQLLGPDLQPSSPPLLLDFANFGETYDDLLAPMSDLDVALMDSTSRGMGPLSPPPL